MLQVTVDQEEIKQLYDQKLEEHLKKFDRELVYWDRKELIRRTCMSWTFIQQKFFFDDRFPRRRVGTKWLFPAKETEQFLLQWIKEQSRS